jgi:hypothetical protein
LYAIGIDAGTKTGLAVWDVKAKRYDMVLTVPIHRAWEIVLEYKLKYDNILVVCEDARQVKFKTSVEKAQGAGSVKRDAAIWEGICVDKEIAYEMRRPNKAFTKWSAQQFATATGYPGRTDNHGRDAGMLVYDF